MSQKNYTLQEIARTVEATFLCCADENESISHILLDSRQVHTGSGTLFFAIEGIQHDGHDFIPTLIESGIRNFVVSKNLKINKKLGSVLNVLKVDDSIKALQKLAAFHRSQFTFPLIGITGSNGKTIVKEWLFQLLDKRYNIVRSPKSYNSQIGVPLSVWQIKPEHSLGIIEAGISKPGEMERLEKVIRPDIGILTNIGYAHAEGFQNSKQKLREKLHLFANSEVLICPADDPLIQDVVEEFKQERKKSLKKPLLIFNWGKSAKASVKIGQIKTENTRTAIALKHNGNNYQFNIPFSDKASIENAISCATCGIYLQAADEVFLKSFEQLSTVAMRLELKDAVNQCSLINDSYNSDLGSLKIALDFLKQQQQHSKRTLILSDILQSGMSDKTLLNEVVRLVKDSDLQKFIGIGPVLYKNRDLFKELKAAQFFYKDTEAFLNAIQQLSFYDESILLKGARNFHFEKISRLLERKFHETVFEINLNAVSHNLAAVRNHLGDKTKIMA
ncbi:MAG: UDP-N-acetylmuramoyl-tripeptide--D-alanyl-D-alanine ligase, partial [Chitinophagales bacterium]